MRLGSVVPFAVLGVLMLGLDLSAQTLPVPILPIQPEPSPIPETPQAPGPLPAEPVPPQAQLWEYTVGLGATWDSNVQFQVPDGAGGAAIIPSGALTRVLRSPRGELRAAANGRWVAYPDRNEPSRGYAKLGFAGNYRSTPNTSWRANAFYEFGHTDSSQPLRDQGVLLPLVKTRTIAGELGLSWQTAKRTSLRIEGRIYRTEFDSATFPDAQSVRGTLGLDRRLSSRSTAAIVYSLEHVVGERGGQAYLTHYGSLQWTRVLSPRAALLLEGGASYTPEADRAGLNRKAGFFGGASLRREVGRSSLMAFVRREVVPAFGTGFSQLEARAGLSAAIPIGRRWELNMAAILARSDTPASPAPRFPSGDEASASLGRRLGSRLAVSGEASYRRRGAANSLRAIEAYKAGLFLTLSNSSGIGTRLVTGR